MQVELLIHARWLIPIQPEQQVLEHYALAIDAGRIQALLPSIEAEEQIEAKKTVRLDHHAVLPGFINAHTHSPMSLFCGLADDLHLMEWLEKHIWPAEQKWVSASFVADGSRLAIATMIRSGTTCFNDMYFFPEITGMVADEIGMRAVLGRILIDFPSAWAQDRQNYLDKGEILQAKFEHHDLIQVILSPHAPYSLNDESLQAIQRLSERYDLPVHIHLHETQAEIEQSLKQYQQRPLARLKRLGLLNDKLIAVHMTQLEEDEIECLARSGTHVVHCPESNLKLASGFCPTAQLSAAGINIALGTDGAASNNDLDMIGEMRAAALLGKGVAKDPTVLPAFEVLKMATLNGAKALGLQDKIGSLEVGKCADIIAIDLSALETHAVFDPISQIVYATTRNQVSDVWIGGRRQLKQFELCHLNEDKLCQKALYWQQKIKGQNDE